MDFKNVATMLGGFGAGYSGQGGQYLAGLEAQKQTQMIEAQRQQQLSEERKKAMIQDAYGMLGLLEQGKVEPAVRLGNNRLEVIKQLGGDPSDTQEIMGMITSGDPAQFAKAKEELRTLVDAGIAGGYLQLPEQEQMNPYQKANIALKERELEWKMKNPDARGDVAGVQSSQILDDGTVVQVLKNGSTRVVDPAGNELKGDARAAAVRSAQEYGIDVQSGRAGGRTTAAGTAKRVDEFINQGVTAAQSVPVMKRAVDLLNQVETGGIDKVQIAAKQMFGIESADEGELSYLLAKNVLSQLKETFGAAFTAAEGERLSTIEASIGRSPAANKRIISQALQIAEKKAARGKKAAEDSGDDFTAGDIDSYLNMSMEPKTQEVKSSKYKIEVME